MISVGYAETGLLQPMNLNFEESSVGALPRGWEITAKNKKAGYKLVTSTLSPFEGKKCLEFSIGKEEFDKIEDKNTYISAFQNLDATRYKGKKIIFSAYMKGLYLSNGNAKLYLRTFLNDGKTSESELSADSSTQDEWKPMQIEARISEEAQTINFGLVLKGSGFAYLDAANIKIIDESEIKRSKELTLNDENISNIISFAKTYSNLCFFYPSDEAEKSNQDYILLKGVKSILNLEKKSNLKNFLSDFFSDIAPLAKFSNEKLDKLNLPKDTSLNDIAISWQHNNLFNPVGNGFFASKITNLYESQHPQEGITFHVMDAKLMAGKKLKLKFSAKTDLIGLGSNAQVWVRIDRKEEDKEIKMKMDDAPITSKEWKEYTRDIEFPNDAQKLRVGLVLYGDGKAWFDNVYLEESNGVKYQLINGDFEMPKTDKLQKWSELQTVKSAGYFVEIDTKEKAEGKQSISISSDTTALIKFADTDYTYSAQVSNSPNLFVTYPLVLAANQTRSLPVPANPNRYKVKAHIDGGYAEDRIALGIYLYSQMHQFSKANNDTKKLDSAFIYYLKAVENNINDNAFKYILNSFLLLEKDALARIWNSSESTLLSAGINWAVVGNQLIITEDYTTSKSKYNSLVGSKVIDINGRPAFEEINSLAKYFYSQNNELSMAKAMATLRFGKSGELLKLKILQKNIDDSFEDEPKEIELDYSIYPIDVPNTKPDVIALLDTTGIYYVDATRCDDYYLRGFMQNLKTQPAKTIIFDFRGVSLLSEYFLGFLSTKELNNYVWQTYHYTKPEKQYVSKKAITPTIKPLVQSAVSDSIIFLIDEKTIGYSEAITLIAKTNLNVKIIGKKSAGCFWDVASLQTLGDYNWSVSVSDFSLKQNGSIKKISDPIEPDILVDTNKLVVSSQPALDMFIQKALDYARGKK